MAKIDNLEATIAGLKSENEHLLRLLVRSTPVRLHEWLSECWNFWFQECTSHHRLFMSPSDCSPKLARCEKTDQYFRLEHISSIMSISLADVQQRSHEDLHNLYNKFLIISIQRLSLGEQCLYSKIKKIKPYLYVQYLKSWFQISNPGRVRLS